MSESMREKRGPESREGGVLSGLPVWAKGIWSRLSTEALSDLSGCSVGPGKVPLVPLFKAVNYFNHLRVQKKNQKMNLSNSLRPFLEIKKFPHWRGKHWEQKTQFAKDFPSEKLR